MAAVRRAALFDHLQVRRKQSCHVFKLNRTYNLNYTFACVPCLSQDVGRPQQQLDDDLPYYFY